jgi:hypothetical protein
MAPDRIPPSQSYLLGTVDLENSRMNQDQVASVPYHLSRLSSTALIWNLTRQRGSDHCLLLFTGPQLCVCELFTQCLLRGCCVVVLRVGRWETPW